MIFRCMNSRSRLPFRAISESVKVTLTEKAPQLEFRLRLKRRSKFQSRSPEKTLEIERSLVSPFA